MKVKAMEFEYSEEEIKTLLLEHHVNKIGAPPDGFSWSIDVGYKVWQVTAEPITNTPVTPVTKIDEAI